MQTYRHEVRTVSAKPAADNISIHILHRKCNKYKEIVNRKRNNIDPHHRILKHCNPFFYILHSTAISHARCRIHNLCCRKYRKVITLCTAIPHQNSHQTGQSVSHQHINNQPRFCYFFLFYFQTPPIKS